MKRFTAILVFALVLMLGASPAFAQGLPIALPELDLGNVLNSLQLGELWSTLPELGGSINAGATSAIDAGSIAVVSGASTTANGLAGLTGTVLGGETSSAASVASENLSAVTAASAKYGMGYTLGGVLNTVTGLLSFLK
ncbi:MAG: hypothetical protein QHH75_11295 [Bacillota bacterium]|nr:hypothetical protein [Bacillota bacterium]